MATSVEFRELSQSISRVKRHFVARSSIRGTGPFADRVYDRVRALRVLACAEFERYFEARALSVANKAVNFRLKAPANEIITSSLIASYLVGFVLEDGEDSPRKKIARNFFSGKYADFRMSSLKAFESWVGNNNGVRDENLEHVLRPIGFDMGRFDPLFLPEITQFSKQRGEIAHKGVCVTLLLNPADEFARIDNLLQMIRGADPLFEAPNA